MFTGIIEEIGTVASVKRGRASSLVTIQSPNVMKDVRLGDSIAVDGVCLTVSALSATTFSADLMHETLKRTTLGELKGGSRVNLERAMPANGRFGGHIVSGHIDGTGTITSITKDDNAIWYTIRASNELLRYVVEKGSIALDGISLTVASVSDHDFSVSIIPHTASATTLSKKRVSSHVNLECDIIGKYVEKLLGLEAWAQSYVALSASSGGMVNASDGVRGGAGIGGGTGINNSTITTDFLAQHGF